MRSRSFTARYPVPVLDGMKRRKTFLKYKTMGIFQTNLNRCDQIYQPDHDCTIWISEQSLEDQDFIDDCLRVFPKPVRGSQPSLSHYFCDGMIKMMMDRHHCDRDLALTHLPASVRELCAECGFC